MSKDWTQQKAIEVMEKEITALRAENEKLRAALQEIASASIAQSDRQAWAFCHAKARTALEGKP